jgi:tripartite-type tricarboxylate transporter receptor subunit TctC
MQKKSLVLLAACLLTILIIGGCTSMENKMVATTSKKYPDKPITIIVPFSIGGASDMIARSLEMTSDQHLGQPLVVVNKPGGAGSVAWNDLASASSDGYTIGISGVELLLQPLYETTKYNYPTALDPLVQIATSPVIMAVLTEQPWNNLDDLIKYAKKHPGEIKFGHGGIGSIGHVTGETLAKSTNIILEQVPFRGAAEGIAALLGKHIQVAFINPAVAKDHMQNGRIKVLALTGENRLTDPSFTDVPTFKEYGLDITYSNSFGVAAPKDLPLDVKTKLVKGLKEMISEAEFKRNMDSLGLQIEYLGPEESQEKWLRESQKLTNSIQEAGILDLIKAQKK